MVRRPLETGRLQFLDALRGVAVLLVLVQHVGQALFEPLANFTTTTVQLGQFGVLIFFLCSGYIIPATMERRSSLAEFWTSRFFRLYPMYWTTLALVAIAIAAGAVFPPISLHEWASNITMLQLYLGGGNVLGPFWSLGWELTFYFLMSALFLVSLNTRTRALSLTASGVILLGIVASSLTSHNVPLGAFDVATMLTGTLVYRVHNGQLSWRETAVAYVAIAVAGVALLVKVLGSNSGPADLGDRRLVPMLCAWSGAYLIFHAGAWWWRKRGAPGALTAIGRWSYSIYLLQGIAIVVITPQHHNKWLIAAAWCVVTIGLSAVTYRFVEAPSIALGRRIIARRSPSAVNH